MNTLEQEREAFETWWNESGDVTNSGPWNPDTHIQHAWDAWVARSALAQPAAPAQAVSQWRTKGTCPWVDGHPDHSDGGGPYETRTLHKPSGFVFDTVLAAVKPDDLMPLTPQPAAPVQAVEWDQEVWQQSVMELVEKYGDECAVKAYHGELHCREKPKTILGRIEVLIASAPAPELTPMDAVYRAMDMASLLAGAVAANNTERADTLSARLRSHLVKYMRPVEPEAPVAVPDSSFPERDTTKSAEQQGLFRKFEVYRVDGSDKPGGKHHGCEYFVLDMDHDKHAPVALRAYAADCASTHPQLSSDLVERFGVAPVAVQPLTSAARDVLAERQRQVSEEGWTPKHDDYEHREGELSLAAAGYAVAASDHIQAVAHEFDAAGEPTMNDTVERPSHAPWPQEWSFKPAPARRLLVKAGALILAELERIDRASSSKQPGSEK